MYPKLLTIGSTTALIVASALIPVQADTTSILTSTLGGVEGMEANIVRFDVDEDWETDRHIHPGHVFVYVTEGSIEIDVEGQEARKVAAGEAFQEPPDRPMVARTLSSDGASFIVFQVGPKGEPIMVSQPE
ncbi:quercetin dioxygenase-like cupin family protein [Halomonas fontilapidosi]|uniref:Quercetin dioxygenase-like cupin family protein n=1 Tax=Halomonas fontilapidosi TaxID=616675 RepID=A0A7W5DLC0_9GAMM|nr:cupin domain-containing protein [Halomonas fontilapidosi]MBB3185037.1 quercetin dioxygenase-like cupin family protein [Halomonas fontilapidosi]